MNTIVIALRQLIAVVAENRKSCPGGEIGKLTTLKMLRRKACGFKSRPGHNVKNLFQRKINRAKLGFQFIDGNNRNTIVL